MPARPIVMLATGRTGLGHLRRLTNIAMAFPRGGPPLVLATNSEVGGIEAEEAARFVRIETVERDAMAAFAGSLEPAAVVVDTAVIPGLARLAGALTLIMRESPDSELARFQLEGGRAWDLVLAPHPADWWVPDAAAVRAKRVEAVGWVYRPPAVHTRAAADGVPELLVASGGGGTVETAAFFARAVDGFVAALRATSGGPVRIVQALGPRAPTTARLVRADAVVDPGARLHERFAAADLVVTTAGYNSTLELALLDVPVLFVPISRTHDDQTARALRWARGMGRVLDPDAPESAAHWAGETLAGRLRRPPVPLGPSGCAAAARAILGLVA